MKGSPAGKNLYLIALILMLFFPFQAVYPQASLSDSIVSERINTIEKLLKEGRPKADLWWYGWLAGYSAATVGQGIVWVSSDELSQKQDMALGAATTFLGAVGQLITPMVPGYAPDRLSQFPDTSPEDRLKKLQKAEELLRQSAERERSGRSWQTHAVAGVVNLSSGLITWLGFNRDIWAGVGNFAINTFITEAQIWSQPTRAIKDYQNYTKKYSLTAAPSIPKPGIRIFAGASPGRFRLKILF